MPHGVYDSAHLTGERPVLEYQRELRARHAAWAGAAIHALTEAAESGTDGWGSKAKRIKVAPTSKGSGEAADQPLGEVINQCATVERLLDALTWVTQQSGGDCAKVLLCHPTASSSKSENAPDPSGENVDHDLIVRVNGEQWRFEVSDVANADRDGNRKEAKDLKSLGYELDESPPTDGARRFLVVSKEFGRLIGRKHAKRRTRSGQGRNGKAPPWWQYCFHECRKTYIVEVRAIAPGGELVVDLPSAAGIERVE